MSSSILRRIQPGSSRDSKHSRNQFFWHQSDQTVCIAVENLLANAAPSTSGELITCCLNPAEISVLWGSAGSGNIILEIQGPSGTLVISQCIEIGESPTAMFTAPSPVCKNTGVQFTSTSTPGADHFWDPPYLRMPPSSAVTNLTILLICPPFFGRWRGGEGAGNFRLFVTI